MVVTSANSHCSSAPSGGAGGSGSRILRVGFVDAAAVSTVVCVKAAAGLTGGVFVEVAAGLTGGVVAEAAAESTGRVVFVEAVAGSTGVVDAAAVSAVVLFSFQWFACSWSLFSKNEHQVVGAIIVDCLCRPVKQLDGVTILFTFYVGLLSNMTSADRTC